MAFDGLVLFLGVNVCLFVVVFCFKSLCGLRLKYRFKELSLVNMGDGSCVLG